MKAIIHVDGDAFFASCEVAQNERLRGKPVVTGEEKGIALAVSYEAKAHGVSRGMLMGEIRKLCPSVTILPGNYDLYKIYCRRMYTIVRRHAPVVEEYSIDECFADISSCARSWEDAVLIARRIKHDLEHDLGMTFSLGLAPTKTLAKVASKCKKPAGFTAMQQKDVAGFLDDVPIGAVWGIGASMSQRFHSLNIKTALQFTKKDFEWVREHFTKPCQEIWYELNGTPMHQVREGSHEKHQSIRATRTFRPPTRNKNYLLSELSKNAEKACAKLRHYGLQAKTVSFFLKTQTFRYHTSEIRFDGPVTSPSDIMNEIKKKINEVFKPENEYRATGIVLHTISPATIHQNDLFGMQSKSSKRSLLHTTLDKLNAKLKRKQGRVSVFLASSLSARLSRSSKNTVNQKTLRNLSFQTLCLRLGIPYWGETSN